MSRYASQQHVRGRNLGTVAEFVRSRGECSRTEIGLELGFNKATVSSLVGDLIGLGLLEDGGRHTGSGPGRPRTVVRPDMTRHVSLVVELLPDRVRLSSWTLAATGLGHRTIDVAPTADGPEQTLRVTADALTRLVRRLRKDRRVVTGIAVSVPGLVDTRTGSVVLSSPLKWRAVDIRAALLRRAALRELPVVVERVANLATVAEWRHVALGEDLICLHGGETGLGVGVVTGGRLLSGANGRAGGLLFADNVAIGSKPLRQQNLGLVDLLTLVRDRDSSFQDESDALAARLRAGDRRVAAAVQRFARNLGPRLVALLELFDPAEVVFSGPLAPLTERLVPPVQQALRRSTAPEVNLRAGTAGPEASLMGAAILLADRIFSQVRTTEETA